MSVNIKVECSPDAAAGAAIRTLFCQESAAKPSVPNRNPLVETDFNSLLNQIAQIAFDEGREFQKKNPKL